MKAYYLTLIRPVGSGCWTVEKIAPTLEASERQAAEERNRNVRFHDGSMHLQSTATVCVLLPGPADKTQQHYKPMESGTVKLGIALPFMTKSGICIFCGLLQSIHKLCPECGYTWCDCQVHLDHWRCGMPTPERPVGSGPKHTYNVGDWVLFEFALHQVLEVEEERVTKVSDGGITKTSHSLNDRIYPLCVRLKSVSDSFNFCYSKLLKDAPESENFQDVKREMVSRWCDACDAIQSGDRGRASRIMDYMSKWADGVIKGT